MLGFRISVFMFIIIVGLITIIKPTMFFDKEHELKNFGFTYDDKTTPIPFSIFIYGLVIFLYGAVIIVLNRLNLLS